MKSKPIIKINSPEFYELQTKWYKTLKREGFVDIELKTDVHGLITGKKGNLVGELKNGLTASHGSVSLEAAEVDRNNPDSSADNAALQENIDVFGSETTVWETPVANHWRAISQLVQALPDGTPYKAFLETWAMTGDVTNSAKAHNLTRWKGRQAIDRFVNLHKQKGNLR